MGRCVKHVGGVNCSDYLVWKKVKLGHFWTRKRAHVARDMFAAFCWRCDRWPFNSKRWTVTHLFFHVDFFLPLWNGPSISCKNGWRCCLKRMTVEYLYRTYKGNNCSLFFLLLTPECHDPGYSNYWNFKEYAQTLRGCDVSNIVFYYFIVYFEGILRLCSVFVCEKLNAWARFMQHCVLQMYTFCFVILILFWLHVVCFSCYMDCYC